MTQRSCSEQSGKGIVQGVQRELKKLRVAEQFIQKTISSQPTLTMSIMFLTPHHPFLQTPNQSGRYPSASFSNKNLQLITDMESSSTRTGSSSTALKPCLTFGLEFEFCLASLPTSSKGRHPSDPRPAHIISLESFARKTTQAMSLGSLGGKYKSAFAWDEVDGASERETQLHLLAILKAAGIPAACEYDYNTMTEDERKVWWVITTDSTIGLPDRDKIYEWIPIELRSPPYFCTPAATKKVAKVCQLLAHNFRILCHKSCGVLVHIRYGKDEFKATDLRNLIATLWTFEHFSQRSTRNTELMTKLIRRVFERTLS